MQITDTFIAMPAKAAFCNPKHIHAEAWAVAPAGGRREGGGREGGREPQTWSERAAWREGDVIHSTRLLVRSAWQCRELDLVSVYLVGHTARPLSVRALH